MILDQVENLWPMLEFSWWNGMLGALREAETGWGARMMHPSTHLLSSV